MENYTVIKRDNRIEPFNSEKILTHFKHACEGLNMDPFEIFSNFKIRLKSEMHSKDIQTSAIFTAADMIDKNNPDSQFPPARLMLQDLYKDIYGSYNPEFNAGTLRERAEKGYYDKELFFYYTDDEINELSKCIDYNNDLRFTYLGLNQLIKKYSIKRDNKPIETPQEIFFLIPLYIFATIKDKKFRSKMVLEFYQALAVFDIFLPTPGMVGIRTNMKGWTSCFKPNTLIKLNEFDFIEIGDIKIGDEILTSFGNYKKVTNIIKSFKNKFVKLNTIFSEEPLDSTDNHPVFSIIKEDILCARNPSGGDKFGKICPISQGNYKYCLSTKNYYKNNCSGLDKIFDLSIADYNEAGNLDIGDYIGIPIPRKIISNTLNIFELIQNEKGIKNKKFEVLDEKIVSRNIDKDHINNGNAGINKLIKPINNFITIDNNLMEVFGWFLAEGSSYKKGQTFIFTVSTDEVNYLEFINETIYKHFGIYGNISINYEPTKYAVLTFNSKILKTFFNLILNNIKDQYYKKDGYNFNNILLFQEPELQKYFLKGAYLGDGSFNKTSGTLKISLKDKKFIELLKIMHLRNGHKINTNIEKNNVLKNPNSRDSYNINIKASLEKEFIKFVQKHTNGYDKDFYDNFNYKENIHYNGGFFLEDFYFTKITKKEEYLDKDTEVIDITVEDDHTFIAGDYAVHNCSGLDFGDSIEAIANGSKSLYKLITKLRAGIGANIGNIRGLGADIGNGFETHTGITPYAKANEAISRSSTQPNSGRSGAITNYYPFFHIEIEDILQLKNNKGSDEASVRHSDHAIIFDPVFRKRLDNDEDISLFYINDVGELYSLIGTSEFEAEYIKYEKLAEEGKIFRKVIKASSLEDRYFHERYITARNYKVNAKAMQEHSAFNLPVYTSNLCTEIALPSFPDEDYIINVLDQNNYQLFIEGLYKDGKWYQLYRFIRYGVIDEKNAWVVDIHLSFLDNSDNSNKFTLNFGEIFSCILGGINFGNLSTDPKVRRQQFEKNMYLMVYFLDEMIDKQDYQDIKPFEKFTKNRRALGISPGNYFYMLAKHGYNYDTPKARALTAVVFEEFLYYGLKASNEIAKEKGSCNYYQDTKYSKGQLPIDTYERNVDSLYSLKSLPMSQAISITLDMWKLLRKDIQKYGLRNSTLLTAVPSSNSSRPGNMISGINPPQGTEYSIEDNNMKITAILPNSKEYDSFYEYNSAWNLDIIEYWKLIAIMQKFIDQAISINEYVDFTKYPDGKIPKSEVIRRDLFTELFGIKTLYYAKTKTDNDTEELQEVISDDEGCSGGGCTL